MWETERQEWEREKERERETGVREKERDRGVRERKIKRDSAWEIVERISRHFWPNCALFDKSTKIGTEVV